MSHPACDKVVTAFGVENSGDHTTSPFAGWSVERSIAALPQARSVSVGSAAVNSQPSHPILRPLHNRAHRHTTLNRPTRNERATPHGYPLCDGYRTSWRHAQRIPARLQRAAACQALAHAAGPARPRGRRARNAAARLGGAQAGPRCREPHRTPVWCAPVAGAALAYPLLTGVLGAGPRQPWPDDSIGSRALCALSAFGPHPLESAEVFAPHASEAVVFEDVADEYPVFRVAQLPEASCRPARWRRHGAGV